MNKLLNAKLLLLSLCLIISDEARAQEGPVVWQVTRFEITANLPASAAAERALAAKAVLSVRNAGQGVGRQLTARINPAAEVSEITVGEQPARHLTRLDDRTKLKMLTVTLPAAVPPGGTLTLAFEYKLPVTENTGLASLSPEGAQFLPLASWYPTPNSPYTLRGADTAPIMLKVNAPSGETVVSSGQAGAASGGFEQKLYAQPFFVTGKWEMVEGADDSARGISAWLLAGATAEEKKRAEDLVALAGAARQFFATLLGPAPDTPVRLVAVRRGAGFDGGGTVLL
ncbi:MAG: hypothetical protein ACRD9R_18500, partial [Pyrinomonadaceae bacterium]